MVHAPTPLPSPLTTREGNGMPFYTDGGFTRKAFGPRVVSIGKKKKRDSSRRLYLGAASTRAHDRSETGTRYNRRRRGGTPPGVSTTRGQPGGRGTDHRRRCPHAVGQTSADTPRAPVVERTTPLSGSAPRTAIVRKK